MSSERAHSYKHLAMGDDGFPVEQRRRGNDGFGYWCGGDDGARSVEETFGTEYEAGDGLTAADEGDACGSRSFDQSSDGLAGAGVFADEGEEHLPPLLPSGMDFGSQGFPHFLDAHSSRTRESFACTYMRDSSGLLSGCKAAKAST